MDPYEIRLACLQLAKERAGSSATAEQILKDAAEYEEFINNGAKREGT